MRIRSHLRTTALVVLGALVIGTPAACGDSEEDRFSAAADKARTSSTAAPERPVGPGTGEPSDRPAGTALPGSTAFPGDTTSTTVATVPAPEALLAAIDAFRTGLGTTKAVELTVHFPVGSGPYASLSYQLPDRPAAVDRRDWRDGRVGEASPVKLTGSDDVAARVWDLGSVDWNAIAAAVPRATGLVETQVGGPLEGSTGVTHLIAADGAPFFDGTVIRVYVDGGTRHTGGYVALRPDGGVARVVA
ncbi:MAG: hypothetical protein IT194_05635 [Microthrixaceae bacterium]|nr:hypothetical protein [Microthrixaceae bacterium]